MKHIKLFEQFVADMNKLTENFTYADACETAGEPCNDKDIAAALKFLKAKNADKISIMTDTTEDDGADLYDEIKNMKTIKIDSPIYNTAHIGTVNSKPVVVFGDGEDLFAYVKESNSINESFTYADACETAGEPCNDKDIAAALKALKAKTADEISIMTDTTEDDGEDLYDEVKKMKTIRTGSPIYDAAYVGKFKGKDVVVFSDGEDLFAYAK